MNEEFETGPADQQDQPKEVQHDELNQVVQEVANTIADTANAVGEAFKAPLQAILSPLQQQFDDLAKRKMELWDQIKDKVLYELTEQWKEIESIDRQLFVLLDQIKGGN